MPIPKFHEIMLPLLELYADSQIHQCADFDEKLSKVFSLSEVERSERVSSGKTRFYDRILWAHTYLYKAKLLEKPKRGYYVITLRGLEFLNKKLNKLSVDNLIQLYPDILEDKFYNPDLRDKNDKKSDVITEVLNSEQTPDELLDQILDQKLTESYSEIQEQITNISPRGFEFLVNKLLIAMGYGTEEFSSTTSYTNDGGIDGIIQADELGFDKIYVQAKKYEGNVGRPDIQKFVGAMTGTNKGVFITTSSFAPSVAEYLNSRQENVMLIDGPKLIELMYKHNQGVAVRRTIEIKTLDSDYFEELE